ncbi:MAG: dihydrolipoyl dehydrogenase [Stellaceae bacterium]
MSETIRAQVLVVGGGPGGYVAAVRAGELGLDTVLVDAGGLGGNCLMRGCIPSKALIHAADKFHAMAGAVGGDAMGIAIEAPPLLDLAQTIGWKDGIVARLNHGIAGLLARAKVRTVAGWAVFSDAKTCTVGDTRITAEHVILATGAAPVALPSLPFGGVVISSTEALALTELPRRLAVVGAGYIGLELGIAFRKLGSEVTVIETAERILPRYDSGLSGPVRRWLDRAGVTLHTGAAVAGFDGDGTLLVAPKAGEPIAVPADRVLITVGRRPALGGWWFETMAVDLAGGFVRVDEQCRTAMRDVWAIGDLTGEPMLAHRASAQGMMVAEIIGGARRRFTPAAIPAVCFTEPEIVTIGLSPDEAREAGLEASVSIVPLSANGRALTLEAGDDGGFVRIVAARDTGRVAGIQAVGRQIAELAGEFAHALEMGAVLDDIAGTIHAHPTLGEAFGEAAQRGLARGLLG